MDDMVRTYTLSQCYVRHCYECRETRENGTCEGVLFTAWHASSSVVDLVDVVRLLNEHDKFLLVGTR